MAGPIAFNQLVEALVSALLHAQDRIERHQLAILRGYFDDADRPRNAFIRLPSLSHATDEEVKLRVPLLALVHPNLLKIKDVELTFDVDLTDFTPAEAVGAAPTGGSQGLAAADGKFPLLGAAPGTLTVDIPVGKAKDRGGTAKVVLRVEGQQPSEGLARLIHELVKRIGGERA